MNGDLLPILRQLQNERNVDRNVLVEAVIAAVKSAWNKSANHSDEVDIELDEDTMQLRVMEHKTVVDADDVEPDEIILADARLIDPDVEVGGQVRVEVTPRNFGRIAAQTAKQVIRQRIKDAENKSIFEEFNQRVGSLVTGIVKQYVRGNVIIDLGRAEAILPFREQSRLDNYRIGDRLKAFVLDVEDSSRGPQVVLSRAAAELVKELFELEVPEIYDNTIEIKAIAREAGHRTKMAVFSHDSNVDAVGACVGMKGVRVRTIMDELDGEKIDIVKWNPDVSVYISNSLNPAEIRAIVIDEDTRSATVVVPKDQLSLAIGKKGQNARLAAKLTGWQVDIVSEEEMSELGVEETAEPSEEKPEPDVEELEPGEIEPSEEDVEKVAELIAELMQLPGVRDEQALTLIENGYDSIAEIAMHEVEAILAVPGIDPDVAAGIHEAATAMIVESEEEESVSPDEEPAAEQDNDEVLPEETDGLDETDGEEADEAGSEK